MFRPQRRSLVRDTVCVVLVVCLLMPTLGVAQTPQSPGTVEPRAPAVPPQVPSQQLPPPPPPDFPVRAPGGVAMPRADPCAVPGGFGGNGARVPGPDYRLGPGDVLDIQIAGRLDVTRQQFVIDPDGFVSIPPVGSIEVGRLTLREANRRIFEEARTLLRFVDVTVSVLVPRCFEVVLSGEVERPGSIQAAAVRRVHDVVLAAGGITPRGSLRRVVITRDGAAIEGDLLRFELRGDLSQNPTGGGGIRVQVPPPRGAVTFARALPGPGGG